MEEPGLRKRTAVNSDGGKVADSKKEEDQGCEEETFFSVCKEVALPYLSAGLGMVGAGLVLDRVQYWPVFQTTPELFIMVPALIGLKGNLEMTLASRLSTHANLGHLDSWSQTLAMGGANLALIQVQGIVVGALAALFALSISVLSSDRMLEISKCWMLVGSSVVTASLASLSLGIVMVFVIVVSRRYRVNPDNVATPIAAALGDLVTLWLLSHVASLLNSHPTTWTFIILAAYAVIAVWCCRLAWANSSTAPILVTGWVPVLSAMLISSMGGTILNRAIVTFPNIAVFQPVINGVAGNLVGIHASRLSTDLHRHSRLGELPCELTTCQLATPLQTFFCPASAKPGMLQRNCTAARVLFFLVIPGHLVFNLAIGLSQGFQMLSAKFIVLYLAAALLQVGLLLHIGNVMVARMWKASIDPDNSAIPYLTALGDLLGGALLSVVFFVLA